MLNKLSLELDYACIVSKLKSFPFILVDKSFLLHAQDFFFKNNVA